MNKRDNNFDLLRILASIGVIFIHANFYYFQNNYSSPSLSMEYLVESTINIVTRYSVPVFVMLSGGYNLNNTENGNQYEFYKKTTWKIGVPAACAALFFLAFEEVKAIVLGLSIITPIIGFISGFYALWYLLVLAGLYVLTPWIVKLKAVITKKEYCYIAVLLMVWGFGSQIVSDYKLPYTIGTVGAFLGYYLIGDVLLNYYSEHKPAPVYWFISILMFGLTWIARYIGIDFYMYVTYRNFFSPTIIIASICILLGFKEIKVSANLTSVSRLTFYVYIIHTFILNSIVYVLSKSDMHNNEVVSVFIIALLTILLSFGVSLIIDNIWKKLSPIQRRWYRASFWRS